jgi:hypothetical protein
MIPNAPKQLEIQRDMNAPACELAELVALDSAIDWLIIARNEFRQVCGIDGSGDAGLSCDEADFFEPKDHLMDRKWGGPGRSVAYPPWSPVEAPPLQEQSQFAKRI